MLVSACALGVGEPARAGASKGGGDKGKSSGDHSRGSSDRREAEDSSADKRRAAEERRAADEKREREAKAEQAKAEESHPTVGAPRVEFAACSKHVALTDIEGGPLFEGVRHGCRNLKVPEGATATSVEGSDLLVLLCVREREAIDPAACGARAVVEMSTDGALTATSFAPRGDLALVLDLGALESRAGSDLENGSPLRLVVTTSSSSEAGIETRALHTALVWRHPWRGYGHGRGLWLPMPMLTSDLSSSAAGYRLGITPIAIGLGTRWFPSPSSRGYVGVSAFAGWNLLVPNDTQTLSNGTFVRINYEAVGGGVLFDASGWFGLGVGVGHTFTTDSRTDLRGWFWVGPRILSLFGA
ncbi:MAG: hypothetical protein ACHREM_19765 [Polyangiales bacterium]